MSKSLIKFLAQQPTFQVIKGLLRSTKPRHLRDLSSSYAISPAGVSDIIRRLNEAGVLKEMRIGNKRCFALDLSPTELKCLHNFYSIFENTMLAERAVRFSANASAKLKWMDDAYKFYRGIKKRNKKIKP